MQQITYIQKLEDDVDESKAGEAFQQSHRAWYLICLVFHALLHGGSNRMLRWMTLGRFGLGVGALRVLCLRI